jgi:nitroreductase
VRSDVIRSFQRITGAPVVIVVAMTLAEMDSYPDESRARAEYLMAVQSTAMATQNLLLAAHAEGLGACWMCAPLFCPSEVKLALGIPEDWQLQGLLTLLRGRRSVRYYRSELPPADVLERILASATMAPSAHNRQPWRYFVVTDDGIKARLADVMGVRECAQCHAFRRSRSSTKARQSRARLMRSSVTRMTVCVDRTATPQLPRHRHHTADRRPDGTAHFSRTK